MNNNDKAWGLCKELAGLITLPESYQLKGEERDTYDSMVAQDFYNVFTMYNKRYENKQASDKLTTILQELDELASHTL